MNNLFEYKTDKKGKIIKCNYKYNNMTYNLLNHSERNELQTQLLRARSIHQTNIQIVDSSLKIIDKLNSKLLNKNTSNGKKKNNKS